MIIDIKKTLLLVVLTFFIYILQEIDAALISVISFPAFAVDDPEIIDNTREEIRQKLMVRK